MDWRIRRGDVEHSRPLPTASLRQYAETGRIAPSDYVYHPLFERWMYARDVAEIADVLAPPLAAPPVTPPKSYTVPVLLMVGGAAIWLLADGLGFDMIGIATVFVGVLVGAIQAMRG